MSYIELPAGSNSYFDGKKLFLSIPDEFDDLVVRRILGEEKPARFEFTEENLRRIGKYMEENPELKQKEIAEHFGFHVNSFMRNSSLRAIFLYLKEQLKRDAQERYSEHF